MLGVFLVVTACGDVAEIESGGYGYVKAHEYFGYPDYSDDEEYDLEDVAVWVNIEASCLVFADRDGDKLGQHQLREEETTYSLCGHHVECPDIPVEPAVRLGALTLKDPFLSGAGGAGISIVGEREQDEETIRVSLKFSRARIMGFKPADCSE